MVPSIQEVKNLASFLVPCPISGTGTHQFCDNRIVLVSLQLSLCVKNFLHCFVEGSNARGDDQFLTRGVMIRDLGGLVGLRDEPPYHSILQFMFR